MKEIPQSILTMLSAWNERHPAALRASLELVLAPDVEFIDPTIITRGIDEFEANVRDFRQKYPEAVIRRASKIDLHHQMCRYLWEITIGDELLVAGMDVTELAADGKVRRVLGFFGRFASDEEL